MSGRENILNPRSFNLPPPLPGSLKTPVRSRKSRTATTPRSSHPTPSPSTGPRNSGLSSFDTVHSNTLIDSSAQPSRAVSPRKRKLESQDFEIKRLNGIVANLQKNQNSMNRQISAKAARPTYQISEALKRDLVIEMTTRNVVRSENEQLDYTDEIIEGGLFNDSLPENLEPNGNFHFDYWEVWRNFRSSMKGRLMPKLHAHPSLQVPLNIDDRDGRKKEKMHTLKITTLCLHRITLRT